MTLLFTAYFNTAVMLDSGNFHATSSNVFITKYWLGHYDSKHPRSRATRGTWEMQNCRFAGATESEPTFTTVLLVKQEKPRPSTGAFLPGHSRSRKHQQCCSCHHRTHTQNVCWSWSQVISVRLTPKSPSKAGFPGAQGGLGPWGQEAASLPLDWLALE